VLGGAHGTVMAQVIGDEDVRRRGARTAAVGRRCLPPHAVAVTAGTMA
jgi:hypothetical protein